jgi:hypothetical protein
MRILCEVTWEKEGELEEGEPVYEKGQYWILHFGLDYKLIEVEEGKITAVNYTVIICQHCKTGQIEKFLPEQVKILGTQIKE